MPDETRSERQGDEDFAEAAGFMRRHPILTSFIIPLTVGVAAVVGVRIIGPSQEIAAVRNELHRYKAAQDSAIVRLQVRDSLVQIRLSKIDEVLAIWLRGECLDRSERDRLLMGLTCGRGLQ